MDLLPVHSQYHNEDRERPPVEFENGEIKSLLLNATFDVLEIFDINEEDSTIDIYFVFEIQWFAKNHYFEFLKKESDYNYLNETLKQEIWTPRLEFLYTDIRRAVSWILNNS